MRVCRYRLTVRTSGSHPGNRSSILRSDTNETKIPAQVGIFGMKKGRRSVERIPFFGYFFVNASINPGNLSLISSAKRLGYLFWNVNFVPFVLIRM
ncbi:MAG: hypothetical protein US70_C0038G0003 [Parcubacteria group bacterium GW2011_GWD2_38_11]|nr:MAG: hypothetical protein US70_C0038G0003 [Parcubacteria group bacterium GW2011_GWD2_38_11]